MLRVVAMEGRAMQLDLDVEMLVKLFFTLIKNK
jgi:hypothetical protein